MSERRAAKAFRRGPGPRGMTLLEVMIAMFIFLVGIVGVLAAIPAGINSAEWVIFQDASIHLAHSKFAEFRRDRADPAVDLISGSAYLVGKHGKEAAGGWHDFYYAVPADANQFDNDAYRYFDDIHRYEWRVEQKTQYANSASADNPQPPTGFMAPVSQPAADYGVSKITVIVHMKGTSREFRFNQYMIKYD